MFCKKVLFLSLLKQVLETSKTASDIKSGQSSSQLLTIQNGVDFASVATVQAVQYLQKYPHLYRTGGLPPLLVVSVHFSLICKIVALTY